MFATLFVSAFQFILFVGSLMLFYQVFVSDWISEKNKFSKERKEKSVSLEKIAKVKLVSDDAKDIEKFVTDNANYLSAQMVEQLASRIENLRIDSFLTNEDSLKKRIADLPQVEDEDEEESKQSYAKITK